MFSSYIRLCYRKEALSSEEIFNIGYKLGKKYEKRV